MEEMGGKMKKKILIVDDSALMRRIMCDIINSDERFEVVEMAANGEEALNLILKNQYDTILMDVNMPKLSGIEVLKELKKRNVFVKIVMVSTETREGAQITMEALDLGAVDFAHKPNSILDARAEQYKVKLLQILEQTTSIPVPRYRKMNAVQVQQRTSIIHKPKPVAATGKKIVAIASSTGGPKALQSVIPKLPGNLDAPVVVVQHMPKGFTESLAERLNSMSELTVSEAKEGDVLQKGHAYIARGGVHLKFKQRGRDVVITYSDEPTREGVRPCANYMYESIVNTEFSEVICVVMTGMGADGTAGIKNLQSEQKGKNLVVLAQEESTCVVYGMPRAVVNAGLADEIVPLEGIAKEIITNVGVK